MESIDRLAVRCPDLDVVFCELHHGRRRKCPPKAPYKVQSRVPTHRIEKDSIPSKQISFFGGKERVYGPQNALRLCHNIVVTGRRTGGGGGVTWVYTMTTRRGASAKTSTMVELSRSP